MWQIQKSGLDGVEAGLCGSFIEMELQQLYLQLSYWVSIRCKWGLKTSVCWLWVRDLIAVVPILALLLSIWHLVAWGVRSHISRQKVLIISVCLFRNCWVRVELYLPPGDLYADQYIRYRGSDTFWSSLYILQKRLLKNASAHLRASILGWWYSCGVASFYKLFETYRRQFQSCSVMVWINLHSSLPLI